MTYSNAKMVAYGAIFVALLFLASAVPTVDAGSDDANEVQIDVGPSKSDKGPNWEWDNTRYILALHNGLEASSVVVQVEEKYSLLVYVDGSIRAGSLRVNDADTVYIYGTGTGATISSDIGIQCYCKMFVRNVSIGISGGSLSSGDMYIMDCPLISVRDADKQDDWMLESAGTVFVTNSDIRLGNTSSKYVQFMYAANGIFMPNGPSESGLTYDNGSWVSGVTKTIKGDNTHLQMNMRSYQFKSIIVTDLTDADGDLWTWDHDRCVLTLMDGVQAESLEMYILGNDKPSMVRIQGEVRIVDHILIDARGDVTFVGENRGALNTTAWMAYVCGGGHTLTFRNTLIDMKSDSGLYSEDGNISIKNCKSVNISAENDGATGVICAVKGLVEIENSNVSLYSKNSDRLIVSGNYIKSYNAPEGKGLVFDNGSWRSGVTKTISGSGPECSLTISAGSNTPGDNLPMIIALVIIAILVAVGIGIVIASRRYY